MTHFGCSADDRSYPIFGACDLKMNKLGRHRGWLLVYEIQYWVLLVLSLLAGMFMSLNTVLISLVFWGGLIWSLYGSTNIIRRLHIGFNWLAAIGTAYGALQNPSDATNPSLALGENLGAALACAVFVTWALYWHLSARVKNSYPPLQKVNL